MGFHRATFWALMVGAMWLWLGIHPQAQCYGAHDILVNVSHELGLSCDYDIIGPRLLGTWWLIPSTSSSSISGMIHGDYWLLVYRQTPTQFGALHKRLWLTVHVFIPTWLPFISTLCVMLCYALTGDNCVSVFQDVTHHATLSGCASFLIVETCVHFGNIK